MTKKKEKKYAFAHWTLQSKYRLTVDLGCNNKRDMVTALRKIRELKGVSIHTYQVEGENL